LNTSICISMKHQFASYATHPDPTKQQEENRTPINIKKPANQIFKYVV
jgi:hypothetical protein